MKPLTPAARAVRWFFFNHKAFARRKLGGCVSPKAVVEAMSVEGLPMAVPVMRWIGERIARVDALLTRGAR